MTKTFKKAISSLDDIFSFVAEFLERNGVAEAAAFALNFAIEEIFTNMVKYSVHNDRDVLMELNLAGLKVEASITEYDVDEFDITKAADVDTGLHAEERKIGGLGLHLTKQVMDEVHYAYQDRNSIITLIKYLEK